MGWFGWMLLSATALAAWSVAQVLLGWWGFVTGFFVGGLFCLGMAWAGVRRAAADPSRGLVRCAECGSALPAGMVVCRRCGGLALVPGASARGSSTRLALREASTSQPEDDSLGGLLSRATAPVAAQLGANYTWRNWAGALLICAGVSGAMGAGTLGWPALAVALGTALAGLAVLRWMPAGD